MTLVKTFVKKEEKLRPPNVDKCRNIFLKIHSSNFLQEP